MARWPRLSPAIYSSILDDPVHHWPSTVSGTWQCCSHSPLPRLTIAPNLCSPLDEKITFTLSLCDESEKKYFKQFYLHVPVYGYPDNCLDVPSTGISRLGSNQWHILARSACRPTLQWRLRQPLRSSPYPGILQRPCIVRHLIINNQLNFVIHLLVKFIFCNHLLVKFIFFFNSIYFWTEYFYSHSDDFEL